MKFFHALEAQARAKVHFLCFLAMLNAKKRHVLLLILLLPLSLLPANPITTHWCSVPLHLEAKNPRKSKALPRSRSALFQHLLSIRLMDCSMQQHVSNIVDGDHSWSAHKHQRKLWRICIRIWFCMFFGWWLGSPGFSWGHERIRGVDYSFAVDSVVSIRNKNKASGALKSGIDSFE